jgi:hypothetical protein
MRNYSRPLHLLDIDDGKSGIEDRVKGKIEKKCIPRRNKNKRMKNERIKT